MTYASQRHFRIPLLIALQVLAALDVHTAKLIVNKCFRGELLRGRTVILVVSTRLQRYARVILTMV